MLKPWDVEMGFTPVKLKCPKYLRYTFKSSTDVPLENSAVLEGGDFALHPIRELHRRKSNESMGIFMRVSTRTDEGVGAEGAKPPFVDRTYIPSHAGAFRQTTRDLTADALQSYSAEASIFLSYHGLSMKRTSTVGPSHFCAGGGYAPLSEWMSVHGIDLGSRACGCALDLPSAIARPGNYSFLVLHYSLPTTDALSDVRATCKAVGRRGRTPGNGSDRKHHTHACGRA